MLMKFGVEASLYASWRLSRRRNLVSVCDAGGANTCLMHAKSALINQHRQSKQNHSFATRRRGSAKKATIGYWNSCGGQPDNFDGH
ncbi:hypothetical protein Zmor_007573 [Zophobas morio]|uniref:Uncharacterized protein n=1 Tax=Zophobas morio TaxID=2755281 RepID=A0AA38IUC0_9CUCU|nr:hypothetical protein Zmor_007573 [Zophobas morio]